MHNPIPHFKYRFVNISSRRIPCIETCGRVIHEIRNLEEFYSLFGYSPEMSKAGVLPDEYIWAEYIKDSSADFTPCIQMHIIEYLRKHSIAFNKEYGDQCESWIAEHDKIKTERGIACAACRMKPYCEN